MSIGDPRFENLSTGPICQFCGQQNYFYDYNDPYAQPLISCACQKNTIYVSEETTEVPCHTSLEDKVLELTKRVEELQLEIEKIKNINKKSSKVHRQLLKDNIRFK